MKRYITQTGLAGLLALGIGCSSDAKPAPRDTSVAEGTGQGADARPADSAQTQEQHSGGREAGLDDAADGAGAEAGTVGRKVCIEICSGSGVSSCLPPTSCSGGRCVFTDTEERCDTDHDCIPAASFWSSGQTCTKADDCSTIEACVAVNGVGYCTRKPTEANPQVCGLRDLKDIAWPSIEGPDVVVCGRDNYLCNARKVCEKGCRSEADCSGNTPVCDTARRQCVCATGSCTSSSRGRFCLPSGGCGCANDTHCPDSGFNKCYSGMCGCADDGSCAEMLPTLNTVCEVPKP